MKWLPEELEDVEPGDEEFPWLVGYVFLGLLLAVTVGLGIAGMVATVLRVVL